MRVAASRAGRRHARTGPSVAAVALELLLAVRHSDRRDELTAFPSLNPESRRRLAERGIDPDVSLERWLARLTGKTEEEVRLMIVSSARKVLGDRRVASGQLLTQRQRLVLKLAAVGMVDREIADALVISIETARQHMKSALLRLGAHNRTEAVVIALARGELTEEAQHPPVRPHTR